MIRVIFWYIQFTNVLVKKEMASITFRRPPERNTRESELYDVRLKTILVAVHKNLSIILSHSWTKILCHWWESLLSFKEKGVAVFKLILFVVVIMIIGYSNTAEAKCYCTCVSGHVGLYAIILSNTAHLFTADMPYSPSSIQPIE